MRSLYMPVLVYVFINIFLLTLAFFLKSLCLLPQFEQIQAILFLCQF